jgi:hypothetical protein
MSAGMNQAQWFDVYVVGHLRNMAGANTRCRMIMDLLLCKAVLAIDLDSIGRWGPNCRS